MVETSVYIHIPFCEHRCAYCDFNTFAGIDHLIPSYVDALVTEIKLFIQDAGKRLPARSVYFGGGTPSLLNAEHVGDILECIKTGFQLTESAEISLELNPGTVDKQFFADIRGYGVNRISLGMQSSNTGELAFLERIHDFEDVISSVQWAREAGFNNISLDLIYGLPDQTLKAWNNSLEAAIRLRPDHLSLYSLTIEDGTPLNTWVNRGLVRSPDPDLAADMYLQASEQLKQEGYRQYEISNWALDDGSITDYRCQHNLQYWRSLPYVGFGAGAHGYIAHHRIQNTLSPTKYIDRINNRDAAVSPATSAASSVRALTREEEISEVMMMGLRLTEEGVSADDFLDRFGVQLDVYYETQITELIGFGLLEWMGDKKERLRLTDKGRLLGNQVFVTFV